MKILPVLLAACAVSLALAQQQDSPRQLRKHSKDVLSAGVPESAQARRNPFAGNPREAAAGGKLFERHCAECHGAKAAGTRRAPSLLRQEVREAQPGAIFWVLTNGVVRHGMPVWSKLPEPQRWQLVTFVKELNKGGPDAPSR